jgi:hypothetical protein
VRQSVLLDAIQDGSGRKPIGPAQMPALLTRLPERCESAFAQDPARRGQRDQPFCSRSGCWKNDGHSVVAANDGRAALAALGSGHSMPC